jgi:hypothetical protein
MMGEVRIESCRLSDAGPRNRSGNETNGWCGHQALGRAGREPCRGPGPGDAGFIGSHVVDQLVRAGCGEVIVLDNFVRATRDNLAWAQAKGRVTLVEADIRRHDVVDIPIAP